MHVTLQDGNLVIYANALHDYKDTVWASSSSGPERSYFLTVLPDSNLAIYPGSRYVNGGVAEMCAG